MRHARILGLCLVAALAVAAYAVSSASALPEFGKCEAKEGGKYEDSSCTIKAKGKTGKHSYEWLKATQVKAKREAEGKKGNVPFTGANVGSGGVLEGGFDQCTAYLNSGNAFDFAPEHAGREKCEKKSYTFHTESGETTVQGHQETVTYVEVECESENNQGEISGAKNVSNVQVVFRGCKLFGAIPCSNGSTKGEVVVNTLKGELGYINRSEKKVGILLTPAKKNGEFTRFECAYLTTVVGVGNKKEGAFYVQGAKYPSGCAGECDGATPSEEKHGGYDGIISPITPVNQTSSQYTQVFTIEEVPAHSGSFNAINVPSKFEGKHIDALEDWVYNVEEPTSASAWSAAGETITNVNTSEEAGEIKA